MQCHTQAPELGKTGAWCKYVKMPVSSPSLLMSFSASKCHTNKYNAVYLFV